MSCVVHERLQLLLAQVIFAGGCTGQPVRAGKSGGCRGFNLNPLMLIQMVKVAKQFRVGDCEHSAQQRFYYRTYPGGCQADGQSISLCINAESDLIDRLRLILFISLPMPISTQGA